MNMDEVIIKIRENVVDAGGTKNKDDKGNFATLVSSLRDSLFELCNTAVGDKYIFAGYNSTKKPFAYDSNGTLLYNGINLADTAPITTGVTPSGNVSNITWSGGLDPTDYYTVTNTGNVVEFTSTTNPSKVISVDMDDYTFENGTNTIDLSAQGLGTITFDTTNAATAAADLAASLTGATVTSGFYETSVAPSTQKPFKLGDLVSMSLSGPITASGKYYLEADGNDLVIKDKIGTEVGRETITTANGANETLDLSAYGLGTITWNNSGAPPATADGIASSIASGGYITSKLNEEATQDIKFEIGYELTANVTFTGINVVGLGEENMFKILDDLIGELENGASADVLTKYLTKLDGVQSRLLTCTVELGARTQKYDTMENRYSLDYINAEAVRGSVEDIDQAMVIMQMKFAESVYQQALAVGARIIQPTLLDFLR